MAQDQIVTTTTSKKFSLVLNDFWKGLLVAVISPVFTIVLQSLNAGSLTFDWKAIGTTALIGLLSYLSKNFFTPAVTKISMPEGQAAVAGQNVTVSIPKPGETLTTDVKK